MLGWKNDFGRFFIYLVIVSLFFITSTVAQAQSPEKLSVTANPPVSVSGAGSIGVTSGVEVTTVAVAPVKAETNPARAKNDQPSAEPGVLPAPLAPCPGTDRTITADVIALPQPIMLNRLGATVPDGLIFALRQDTVPSGSWFLAEAIL